MQDFLFTLATCSLAMSMIALIFIALTPVLSKKYAAKWRYYTWLIIILGLIIPFRPQFGTAFIEVKAPPVPSAITQPEPSTTNTDIVSVTDAVINYSPQEAANTFNINWYQIIGIIWFAGVVGTIIYHIFRHLHFMKIVNRWSEDIKNLQLLNNLHKMQIDMGISSQIKLKLCPCITSPLLVGFNKSVILLPTVDYETNELTLILKHELIHFKRKDLWYKALVLMATALHWFNPVIYIIAKAIEVQCEISCDEAVMLNTDIQTRRFYSETIICTMRKQNMFQTALSTNFYGGKKGMKNRIFSIMDTRKKKTGITILCLVLFATLTTGAVFAADNKNNATTVLPGVMILQSADIKSAEDGDIEDLLGKNYTNMTIEEYEKKIDEIYGHPERVCEEQPSNGVTILSSFSKNFNENKVGIGTSFWVPVKDNKNIEHVLMVCLGCHFHIKDKSKITIQERRNVLAEHFDSFKEFITTISYEQLTKDNIVKTLQAKCNEISENNPHNNLTINLEIDELSIDNKVIYKKEYPKGLTPKEQADAKGMKYYKVDKSSEEITDNVLLQLYKELGIPRTSSVMFELNDGSILSFIPEDPFSISAMNACDSCKFHVKAYAKDAVLDKTAYKKLSRDKADEIIQNVLKSKQYKDPQQLKSDIKIALSQEFGVDKEFFVIKVIEN